MRTHLEIVRRLADGRYHSGESLAEDLGISRTAVWKAVRKAGEVLGLEVEARRGRGYRLSESLELLDAERILGAMSRAARGRIARLEILDEVPSTNVRLMQEGYEGAPSGTLCLAERQSAGRGRRGRGWVSPFGANVYLSLLWRFGAGPGALGGLSLAAGAAVAEVLEAVGVGGIGLKWPNDLLWQRRKLGGLLLEVVAEAHGPSMVVLGLGLNTRLRGEQIEAIDQPWVDLDEILGPGRYSRNRLAAALTDALTAALEQYGQAGLVPFLSRWERYDLYRGEIVGIHIGDRVVFGVQAGITDQGGLRVDVDGTVETFQAGEVSLRDPNQSAVS